MQFPFWCLPMFTIMIVILFDIWYRNHDWQFFSCKQLCHTNATGMCSTSILAMCLSIQVPHTFIHLPNLESEICFPLLFKAIFKVQVLPNYFPLAQITDTHIWDLPNVFNLFLSAPKCTYNFYPTLTQSIYSHFLLATILSLFRDRKHSPFILHHISCDSVKGVFHHLTLITSHLETHW